VAHKPGKWISVKIGDWQIDSFVSGRFRLDGGAMFGVVPKKIWERAKPADEANRITMVMRLLLLRGHGKTVVVDAGCGFGYGDKLARIYAFESNVPMGESLAQFGVRPEDVTDVLVTHLHFDHGGGLATPRGDGWALTFPNAAHHIQRVQWEHALAPNLRDRASYFNERIEIIDREGRLILHDRNWNLTPDIELLTFDGHTPGQQLPLIGQGDTRLFFCGDLIPMQAHFPTPYIMSYDLQPVTSMEEKVTILTRAAAEGWVVVFEHDPDVVACTVQEESGRFHRGEDVDL
jgi:glyoxylase-like metal-dependent hydrolase (beta-lactamase superfamily II)